MTDIELDHIETLDDLSNAIRAAQDQIDGLSSQSQHQSSSSSGRRGGLSRHSSVRTGLSLGDIGDTVDEDLELQIHPLQNVKDLLQSLQTLVETLFEIRVQKFLQYAPSLESLVTQLSDIDPQDVLHVRTLVELMNATAKEHTKHQCTELRFVTLLEIAVSYNEKWEPSENLNSIWTSQLELMAEDDVSPQDFRKSAYKVLISLPWVPSSYGLAAACDMETQSPSVVSSRQASIPKEVWSRLRNASLPKSEPLFRVLGEIEDKEVFTIVVTHSYDDNNLSGSGIGKTTFAALLVSHPQLASKYKVLWVETPRNKVGLNFKEYMECLDSILMQLGEKANWSPWVHRLEDASLRKKREKEFMVKAKRGMSKLLKQCQEPILLVVDGADHENDVEKFNFLESQSMIAITKSSFLPRVTYTAEIDSLSMDEATHLFAEEAGLERATHILMQTVEFQRILQQCQCQPLLIRLIGRYFRLKRVTAGFVKSMEEMSLELSVLQHDNKSDASKILAEILKFVLSPARRSGGEPTKLLKLCFASVGVVFADSWVPLEAVHALWSNLLRTHPDAVDELGFDVPPTDLFKRVVFISECFVHLGILDTEENHEKDQVMARLYHPMFVDYAESLVSELTQARDNYTEVDARWHGSFAAGYHALRKIALSTDGLEDRCRKYALKKLVYHMLESRNIPKVVEALSSEAFFKERIRNFGYLKGTEYQIEDCLLLEDKAKASKSTTTAQTRVVMLSILKKMAAILGKSPASQDEAECIERSRAMYLVGFVQAENQSYAEALSQYKAASNALSTCDQTIESPFAIVLMYSQAVLLLTQNEFEKAHKKIKDCIKIFDASMSSESGISRSELLQLKGDALVAACDYLGAEECYKEALDPVHNKESRIDMGSAFYRKGKLHQVVGELDAALDTFVECIEWKHDTGETDTIDLVRVNSSIGDIYLELQHDRKALKHFEVALRILDEKTELGVGDVDRKMIQGKVYFLEEQDDQSNAEFDAAMKLITEAPTYLMDRSAHDIRSMARVCMDRGDKKHPIEMLEIALSYTTNHHESLERATLLFELGHCLYEHGDKNEGLLCFEDSLKIRKEKLGECELVLETLGTIANCHKSLEHDDMHLEVRKQVYELTKTLYHGNDEKSAMALFGVGEAEVALGMHEEAVQTWTECISLMKRALCGDHPYLAELLASLAELHVSKGDLDAAHTCFAECLKNRQANLEPESLVLSETYFSIGSLSRTRGDHQSAKDYLSEALKIQKQLQLSDQTCSTLVELGKVYMLLDDPVGAAGCYERCLAINGTGHHNDSLVGRVKLLKGHAHLKENNLPLATECYESAMENLLGDQLMTAQVSRSLGFVKYLEKAYPEARVLLVDYLRTMDLLKYTETIDYIIATYLLGEINMNEAHSGEAKEMFEVVNAILARNPELCEQLPALNQMASLRKKRASSASKEKGFFSRITELTRLDDEVVDGDVIALEQTVEESFKSHILRDDI